jgi:hypothetical protein
MAPDSKGRPVQPDPRRSRAVLVGVHNFQFLEKLPAVRNNLTALERSLTDPQLWGMPKENCVVLSQPETAHEIVEAVRHAAGKAEDALFVYYAGHGLAGWSEEQLWLTLPSSQEHRVATALPYDWLSHEIRESDAKCKIVILDCCYSGRALANNMGADDLAESALIKGTFLITAAAATKKAKAPLGERYTAFTGELLDTLDRGVPGGPSGLDMMTLFRNVRTELRSKGHPLPQQRNQELGAAITLFRNRAYVAGANEGGVRSRDASMPGGPRSISSVNDDVQAQEVNEAALDNWEVDDPTVGWAWRDDAFRWGPFRAPLIIVEGDGENVIAEDSIRIIIDHEEVQLPGEILEWKREIEHEQESRRLRGDTYFWNGNRYAIDKISITRHADTEAPIISMRMKPSDYYSFLAAQQLDRSFGDGTTPQSRYLDQNEPLDVPAFMSSSLGANMAVVTADHKIIFSQRSRVVGSHPGHWNSSANEALSRDIDSNARNAPNLYNVARRGLREELALEASEYKLAMLALTVDRKNQWGAIFIARLKSLTGDDFLARRSRGVADKFEHANHHLEHFNTHDMVRFMFSRERRGLWAPTAPAVFYLALVNEFGRSAVETDSADAFLGLLRAEA